MDVKVKRRGDEEGAVGPKDAAHFVKSLPKAANVFKSFEREDRADGIVALWQRFHLADNVHAIARPHVQANVGPAWKE